MQNAPLVSVIVVTYKSANTVIGTLDSIAAQTYTNIELIISDDSSPDKTVEIVREWLSYHRDRFVNSELITVEKNTGVSPNMNRALRIARGEWVKPIGGDDTLLPDSIANIVEYVSCNPYIDFGFGKIFPKFSADYPEEEKNNVINLFRYAPLMQSQEALICQLLAGNFLPAPAGFQRLSALKELGLYDESIPMMEDWPMWQKASLAGYQFGFIDKFIAHYYIHTSSSSLSGSKTFDKVHRDMLERSLKLAKNYSWLLWLLLLSKRRKHLIIKLLRVLNPYYYYLKKIQSEAKDIEKNIEKTSL